jgi:photosystem II stability/assembly factor-like uncharacterized protein
MNTQITPRQILRKALMLAVLLLLLITSLSYAQPGWYPVRVDTTTGWSWNFFTNSNTGYSVGFKGLTPTEYFPTVIKTTNAGINWFEQHTPLKDTVSFFRCVFFTDANTGFITVAKVSDNTFGRILKTTNAGINWYNVPLPVSKHMTMIHFINSTTGYATGYEVILKTTDAGENWVLSSWGTGYLFAIHFTDVNTGFFVGNFGCIYKTTNGGNNWSTLQPTSIHLWGLWFINSNTGFAVGGNSNMTPNIILKTTNAGTNWDSVSHSYSTGLLWSVRFISPETGYIIGFCGNVLKTTNGGLNWVKQILPVPDSSTCEARNCFFTSANTGYIASDIYYPGEIGYIFKTTNGGATWIKPVNNEFPTEYRLEQNYPNPFNPVTSIKFQVAGVGHPEYSGQTVTLQVFDLLGKEVAVLVNDKLQAGTYEVTFDAVDLTSGIYFYKLTAGKFTDTKKLVLIK